MASAGTSSTIQTPEFQLERDGCNAGCTLKEDGRTMTNLPLHQSGGIGQSGPRPFAFLGTYGSVDLSLPGLYYFIIRIFAWHWVTGLRCEIGLASLKSLKSLQNCSSGERISEHDIQAPTIVVNGDLFSSTLEGRGWTQKVDTPPPPLTSDTPYTCLHSCENLPLDMNLGFLYDNRQPQSPRVLVVETKKYSLLGVRRLSPCPDLRPVLRVGPSHLDEIGTVSLEVRTGPGLLDGNAASKLQDLLGRMGP